jgi:dTMP kinase
VDSQKGLVIVFDGPDGVGKTTQLKLTAEWLTSQGHEVYTTRASGGTPIGEALRKVSLSDIERPPEVDVYISLAMHTALASDINERKDSGIICLVDRSPMALVAYNIYGSQLEDSKLGYDAFEHLMKLWQPDLILMINADQSIINERRQKRTGKPVDYFEKKDAAFHERVREGYSKALQILQQNPSWYKQLRLVDGAPHEDEVQAEIRQTLESVLS